MVGPAPVKTLHGGADTGRRPHFQLRQCALLGPICLCLQPDLFGQAFWLQIEDEDDARWATVSTSRGCSSVP